MYRLGGEEFAVLLDEANGEPPAQLAERIGARLRGYRAASGATVTTSIGLGTRRPGEPLGDLMGRVDAALYPAKEAGRDCVVAAD